MTNSSRRSFLTSLSSLLGASAVYPSLSSGEVNAMREGRWDISWLDAQRGKHKQVFTVSSLITHKPLHVATNYLDAHEEVFALKYPDVNTVIGITDPGFPLNATDPLWVKFEIGRRWEIKDPATNDWATRNIFMENVPAAPGKTVGIKNLVSRGTIFWQCNNSLGVISRRLAGELNRPADEVRTELIAGFHPWVKLVPAHTFMLGLCQERGFTYESI